MDLFKWFFVALLILPTVAQAETAGRGSVPEQIFDETVFEVVDGKIIAPRAKHLPEEAPIKPDATKIGWRAAKEGDYVGFDAGEIFYKEKGTLEIQLAVTDAAGLTAERGDLETLIALYDEAGTPFFSVGINGRGIMIGSYALLPMLMEDAFGGVGFPYAAKLDGPLHDGTEITITITWGQNPADDRVYVNGKLVGESERRASRRHGNPPGYEPTATLSSFLNGFKAVGGRVVGPPKTLTVSKKGGIDKKGMFKMLPPRFVAIKKVRLSNLTKKPSAP